MKQVEKCEVTIHEMNIRIEEMNRTVIDITSHKTRLSQVSHSVVPSSQPICWLTDTVVALFTDELIVEYSMVTDSCICQWVTGLLLGS